MADYDHATFERKWREYWEREGLYRTDLDDTERKLYVLVMFIYPSGDRLHIGHWYNYGPTDTWARYRRLCGYNVFEPFGYDAFGLPAENYAIKHGKHPAESTRENIDFIRRQLKAIGAMYDWSAEIDTSAPEYYMWTQWVFLQLYHRGLAYKKGASVNWCPSCKTVLAREQVIGENECERCSARVMKKDLVQWFFRITDYADRLLEGLDRIDWPEKTKTMQRNWIGRSEGAEIVFSVPKRFVRDGDEPVELPVFTTRPDTLFGATYMVLAPEHPAVERITDPERLEEVRAYREQAGTVSEIERTSTVREKTGVFTGACAINPADNREIPVWISDYILMSYGTGAIMAVPAHDERDFEFARKFDLPIVEVIRDPERPGTEPLEEASTGPGVMVNSGPFTGMGHREGAEAVVEELKKSGRADFRVNYRLRDWLVSRQRYWGAPIPVVTCDSCGEVPVPEEDLPVVLPEKVDFTPAGDGKSPLARSEEFVNTSCPRCGGPAKRETDTMDTFVCSSWYFLRYLSPGRSDIPFDRDLVKKWLPVDQYVGGAEHAVMHLMYARFVTMVLHDLGHIDFEEPFTRLRHQGTITNQGAKMSKSRGNVIHPEEFIEKFGSDTFRMYLMFMGSYEEGGDWDNTGINGIHRFLGRVWRLYGQYPLSSRDAAGPGPGEAAAGEGGQSLLRDLHYTIKSVTGDLEAFQFNTAIARLMELVNALYRYTQETAEPDRGLLAGVLTKLNILLAPFAPHMAEELWQMGGNRRSVFTASWPSWDERFLARDTVTMAVQVNGRVRGEIEVAPGLEEEAVVEKALQVEKVRKLVNEKPIRKAIVVKNRIVNLVV